MLARLVEEGSTGYVCVWTKDGRVEWIIDVDDNCGSRPVRRAETLLMVHPGNVKDFEFVCASRANLLMGRVYKGYSLGFGSDSWVELLDTLGLVLVSAWAGAGSFLSIDCHLEVVILTRSLKRVWSDGAGLPSR